MEVTTTEGVASSTKRKKRVLTEEEYVRGIEAIIERDFFPDIPILRQKLEWFKSQGQIKTRTSVGEIFTIADPFSSVTGPSSTTPMLSSQNKTSVEVFERKGNDLLSFQTPKQSLDVFLTHFTSEDNASFSELHEETLQRKRLKVQHLLEFPKSDPTKQTFIDCPFNPKNRLFYDSSVTGDIEVTEKELAARVQGPPKEIRHLKTRFPADFEITETKGLKPGVDYHIPGEGVTDKAQRALLSTPTPIPGKNLTPFMTWGELAATPIRLDRTPGFTIKEASDRDVIGRKMASHARKSMLKRSARYTPASVRATPKNLSAAGRKLASALQRTPGTDFQLRASYSRTPCMKSGRPFAVRSATPVERKIDIKEEIDIQNGAKLTDNLLD